MKVKCGLFLLAIIIVSPLFAAPAESVNSCKTEALLAGEKVRQLMQDRNYTDAIKAIDEAAAAKDAPRDYLAYLKGRALFLQKEYDAAIAHFDAVQKDFPKSDWARHARFAKAIALGRKGDYRSAEPIMRAEAEYLLSAEWKRQIADIYLEFADAHFKPPKEDQKPDYDKAMKFYGQALEVEPKPEKRQEIELRLAECRQKLGKPEEAAKLYERFIKDHPESVLDVDARFFLGECYLAQSNLAIARRTWQDMLAKHVDSTSDRIAEAAYQLSRTWKIPQPETDEDLNLGTAALGAFIERYPKHKSASQAYLEIAESYIHRERYNDAAAALQRFLSDERYKDSEQIPSARILLGRCYRFQKNFFEALAVWRDYLTKHPTHKLWSDVQREIIETEYLTAAEKLEAKDFDSANNLFAEFLAKYPLDARNPEILLLMNRKNTIEKKWDEAIAGWRKLVSKYPQSEPASLAQYSIAETLAKELGKFEEALEEYRKVTRGTKAADARQAIAQFTSPPMTLATERVFRSSETPKLKLATRNIESVTVRMYRIDMETYFRKMHSASGVEALDIALIDPDKTFEYKVPSYAKYQELENDVEVPLPGDARGGAMAVTVSSKTLEATTLFIQSDLDVIVKSSRNEVFVFAKNMKTGKFWNGARLLISNGKQVFAEETTGEDGVFQKSYEELGNAGDLRVFAIAEDNLASNMVGLQGVRVATGLADKGYIYTDRPAYRAGQPVHIRGCLRHAVDDEYTIEKDKKFTLQILDARNRLLHQEQVALNDFGSLHSRYLLPASCPQGKCRVLVHDDAGQNYAGEFLVHEYQLEPVQLTIETPRHVYYRGEEIEGMIRAEYSYGAPLAGRELTYKLADGRQHTATTDAKGEIRFKFSTRDFSESQVLTMTAQLPERKLEFQTNFVLAVQGFSIDVSTARLVYLAGESFEIKVHTKDADGEPIGQKLTVKVLEKTTVQNKIGERLVEEHPLETVAADGTARQTLKLEKGGSYVFRIEGTDRFKSPISSQYAVQISDDKDPCRLRILAEKHNYKSGDNATIKLHWREEPALALVTFQGAKVLDYKLVDLKTGMNELVVPITPELAPNFDLAVAVMNDPRPAPAAKDKEAKQSVSNDDPATSDNSPHRDILAQIGSPPAVAPLPLPPTGQPVPDKGTKPAVVRFHEASSPFSVERDLCVKMVAKSQGNGADPKEPLRPGEEIEVSITTTDPQGKPLSAELSLAMVERTLLKRFSSQLPTIEDFFRGLDRQSAMKTVSSITFSYHPTTQAINARLLAEEEREENAREEQRSLNSELPVQGGFFPPESGDDASLSPPKACEPAPESERTVEFVDSGEPGRGYGSGRGLGHGLGKPGFKKSQSLIVKDGTEGEEGVSNDLHRNETAAHNENAGKSFTLPDANEIANLIAQNRGQVVVLDDAGTMKSLSLFAAGRSPKTPAALAAELAKSGTFLLPGLELPETGYWNPSIITDKEGKATVTFTLPEQSTAWSLLAKGITAETLAGEKSDELVVKKELFGQLKLPQAFTDGDEVEIIASIHNNAVEKGQIEATLKTIIAGWTVTEKKSVDVKSKGILDVSFKAQLKRLDASEDKEKVESATGETKATFELTVAVPAQSDGKSQKIAADVVRQSVPLLPFGMPVFATAAGSATADTTVWVEPPQNMELTQPSLQILLGPTVEQSLLDAVLAPAPWCQQEAGRIASGMETTASDLLAALALQKLVATAPNAGGPQAQTLDGHVRSAIGMLVASQNDDGGWSWTIRGSESNRFGSARAVWSLSLAKKTGYQVPDDCYNRAIDYLQSHITAASNSDYESKAILLHALSTAGKGDFALANRLYRERPSLPAVAVAHLALAFLEMDRKPTAGELLDVLAKRNLDDSTASQVELRSLCALAAEQVAPQSPKAKELVDWLMAHRVGNRWSPDKATGPAMLALCHWFAESRFENERYTLTVTVNDGKPQALEIDPAAGTQVIDLPNSVLKKEGKQRVNFQLTGRGRYAYQCILGGFVPADKLKNTTDRWSVARTYEPAPLEADGRDVPRGFKILQRPFREFRNPLTQLPVGSRGEVELKIRRLNRSNNTPEERFEYLVITEPIPNGAGVIERTVHGGFERFEIAPGSITFYVGNRHLIEPIRYELYGYLPGNYRAAPTVIRNVHRPEQLAVATPKSLKVLPSGAKSTDEYQLTPEERFELGKIHFKKGDFKTAGEYLTELFKMPDLESTTYRKTVEMLLDVHLEIGPPAEVVHYFEIIKEKWPDVEIPFAKIVKVGAAYHEMGEFERSYLVFRATVESSFLRETGVAGFLEAQGEFIRSVEIMERLLREYPPEAYVASSQYSLAQHVYAKAPEAANTPDLRTRKINRVDLIRRAWVMLENFLTAYPDDPAADQAAFAAVNTQLELKSYKEAAAACERYIERYPKSELLDSYWYAIGYCRFAAGEDQAALEMCRKVADTKRIDPATGREAESRNKWRAIYILGQIYHSLGQPAEAIREYRRVEDRYADAKKSIEYFLHQSIELPEVTTLKPGAPAEVELKSRNIATCNVRVYRIDLMKFGLLNRNLAGISQINLSGIRALRDETIKLGDGKDYRDRTQKIALPVKDEGAYLVVCRGENMHAGGLVLVTPLAVEVQEDQIAGQVRSTVKDTVADRYLHDVHVKVIGSGNEDFVSGDTDMRGVFVAENIRGSATVIAETGGGRYAFFRSQNYLPSVVQEPGVEVVRQGNRTNNIVRALDSATKMDFTDTPLSNVVDYLKQLHGIDIVLDTKALNDVGVTPETPVTKKLSGISLKSALRLMLKDLGLTTMIRDEVLLVTSPDTAECNLTTTIYPVGDLVEFKDPDGTSSYDFDSLIDLVTKTIKPTTWDDVGGPGSIQPFEQGKSIVLSQTQAVHEEMADLLANLRRTIQEQGLEGKIPVRPRVDPSAAQGMGGMGSRGGMSMGGMGGFGGAGMGGGMGAGMGPISNAPSPMASQRRGSAPVQKTDLLEGLHDANREFQGKQGEQLQRMYNNGGMGGMGGGVSAGKAF